ncbi:MAG: serine/threonine-protein kinase [Defluviitaleaceae bacterium]|nr:serine/threonine-protein kinase [Defluviitaleaceae bacterium]
MYQEQIFFTVGGIAAVFALFLLAYLIISHKKSRRIRRNLQGEATDVLGTTMHTITSMATTAMSYAASDDLTEVATHSDTDKTEIFEAPETVRESDMPTDVMGYLHIKPIKDFDEAMLGGQYSLRGEIGGGGMSRVFLARKHNTGNEWIIKYITRKEAELSGEAEILKELNHPALPKIVDIFEDEDGVCLVESYVEGISMQQVFRPGENAVRTFPELRVLDWAEQLTQALSYLHNLEPATFHHDLKPSNIMITHGDKLVVIDFGISRRAHDLSESRAITYRYAAPEQFGGRTSKKSRDAIELRFGSLADIRTDTAPDGRADIYSLGAVLFEAATGEIPTATNRHLLKNELSEGLCNIICRCLELNPDNRYQTMDELSDAVLRYKHRAGPKMHGALLMRRMAAAASFILIPAVGFCFSMGFFARTVAAETVWRISPEIITVTVGQSSEVLITGEVPDIGNALTRLFMSNGTQVISAHHLNWQSDSGYVAQIEGTRIVGLNEGVIQMRGNYRNHEILLNVNVVEHREFVDISQHYRIGGVVNLFAGSEEQERTDGTLADAEFLSPESLDITESGAVYVADAGVLRRIYNGTVGTITIGNHYLTPHIVRAYGNDILILTNTWQDDGDFFYGIIRLTENGMEGLSLQDARFTTVRDMEAANGVLYFIERNEGAYATYLRTIDLNNPESVRTVIEVPAGVGSLAIAGDRIYMACTEQGVLLFYEEGRLVNLAGLSDERGVIDGVAPNFFQPSRIRYRNNALYVWDFNVLRKLYLENGVVRDAVTLAGVTSPTFDMNFSATEAAESIVLPYSRLMDFIPWGNNEVLLTDPKRGVVWSVIAPSAQ